jgi:hypothetical protein
MAECVRIGTPLWRIGGTILYCVLERAFYYSPQEEPAKTRRRSYFQPIHLFNRFFRLGPRMFQARLDEDVLRSVGLSGLYL